MNSRTKVCRLVVSHSSSAAYCCFICLFVWFTDTLCFSLPVRRQSVLLLYFSSPSVPPSRFSWSLPSSSICTSSLSLSRLSSSFDVSRTLPLIFFLFPFLSPSLHLPSLLPPFLLGSLLTLLNVRAQTSPCRAAPFRREQKQLVSLPFPCFLAASVCLPD